MYTREAYTPPTRGIPGGVYREVYHLLGYPRGVYREVYHLPRVVGRAYREVYPGI